MNGFAQLIVRHPLPIRVGLGVLTLCAALAGTRLRFDFSPQTVYEGQTEIVAFSEQHKALFGHEDAVIIVVIEATGQTDVLNHSALQWQRQLAKSLSEVSEVVRVDCLAALKVSQRSGLSVRMASLLPERELTADDADRAREWANGYPLLDGVLLSADRQLATIVVEFDPKARAMADTRRVVEAVRAAVAKHPPPDGYQTRLTGISVLRVDVVESLQADQMVMFPLCGSMFLLVVIVMFRNLRITLFALAAVFTGVVWTFGIVAMLGQSFNLLSNVVPTLTLVIGAANVVHIVSRFIDELRHHGSDHGSAAIATMREMTTTCLLTFATTAIGFGSLWLSRSVILQQFAVQASLGLVCQYFSIMLILGGALAGSGNLSASLKGQRATSGLIRRLSHVVSGNAKGVMAASLAIVVACGVLARGLSVNSFLYETYDPSHPTMQTIQVLDEKLAGLAPIEVQLTAESEDDLYRRDVFDSILALQQEMLTSDDVRFARSYVDLHTATLRGLPVTDARIRSARTKIQRASNVIRRAAFVADDDKTARILFRIRDIGSMKMNELIAKLDSRLEQMFPRSGPITATVTGDAFLHARCMDRFVRDLFYSLLTASIAIFAVIALLFRSLRVGLLSAIPNLTPLAVTLGYLALRGYPLTAGTVIVFAIALGIAVDDTIHFLSRFREERRKHATPDAIEAVFFSSGRAIVLTTILIISGLSVLLLSAFVPTRQFAELTSVTMGAALLGDLLLLPACLLLFDRSGNKNSSAVAEL